MKNYFYYCKIKLLQRTVNIVCRNPVCGEKNMTRCRICLNEMRLTNGAHPQNQDSSLLLSQKENGDLASHLDATVLVFLTCSSESVCSWPLSEPKNSLVRSETIASLCTRR